MYKMLIVEDEKSTRKGLRECVDWYNYHIEVAAEASNGQEALTILSELQIDIVLTDVVMPLMDGIELVRQIRQRDIPVKVVFISGYWEMPFLKNAFELEASDYILKPIDLKELDKVIQKVVGICSREVEQKKTIQEMKGKLAASMPALREQFIAKLLAGNYQGNDNIEQRLHFLELPFNLDGYYTVLTIEISNDEEDEAEVNLEQQEIQHLLIKDIVESTINTMYKAFSLMTRESYLSVVVFSQESILYDDINCIIQKCQELVQKAIKVETSIGIGEEVRNIRHLHRAYQKSLHALEHKYFLGRGKVIHYRDMVYRNSIEDCYPHHLQEQIISEIYLGREQKVRSLIEQFFQELQDYQGIRMEYVQTICLEFIVLTEKIRPEYSFKTHNIMQRNNLLMQIPKLKTLKETEEWMCSQLCSMAKQVADIHNQQSKGTVERIKKVIRESWRENITIQTLSEKFYLTPNYISMLFKKETGESFKEYLTRVRMENVKRLLKDPSLKLYEIAEEAGYTDPEYFTKVFKKYIGVTPTEYRETLN